MAAEKDILFDYEKFRAAVHFVCNACNPEELGRLKLHKILYYADFLHYLDTGAPLTGEDYVKQQFGPAARHLNKALRDLQAEGLLEVRVHPFYGHEKQEFISLQVPASNRLTIRETALLREVTGFVCRHAASEMSELSHSEPWQSAKTGERIPYFSAGELLPYEIGDDDLQWIEGEARRLGLVA